jgi:hypothetical protein
MMAPCSSTRRSTYAADPDTVFAMLCDQSWREEVCRRTYATEYTVTVEQRGDDVVVRTTRIVPAPEGAKKIVGATLTVEQTETLGPRRGRRRSSGGPGDRHQGAGRPA